MPLLVLGINHHSAPVEVREKLAIGDRELPRALAALAALPGRPRRRAAVHLQPDRGLCRRRARRPADPEDALADFSPGWHGLSRHEFDGHLYCYRDGAAANHLFSVAAGIDSMILGEPDIQRQVRQALEAAQGARSVGDAAQQTVPGGAGRRQARPHRDRHRARDVLASARRRWSSATQIFGESLAGHTVLVLGAGKMSEVTARHLQARGAPAVLVANRTFEKAQQLAAQFGGQARRFDDLPQLLLAAPTSWSAPRRPRTPSSPSS